MNKLVPLMLLIIVGLTINSCDKETQTKKSSKTIGVSLLTRGHIFYRDLEEGLKNEADKYGYSLIITSAEWDLGKQISQIEDFVSRKVDAVIVCPVDSKGIGSGISEANKAGIPVFTADIAAEEGKVVSHIASDNVQGGRLAGEYLANLLNGKGNVAIVNQPAITSVQWDLGKQISQIEDFVSRKVDAVIVCPVDSKGIGSGISEANKAGIPVFTADIAAEEGKVVSHIASDNVQGGSLAGEYLAKLLNGKGNVAIVNQPAITSVLDRVSGFKKAISKYPGIEIVADVNGQGVRDRSLQVTADVLQANPELDGIFGINDDSALGALDAVNQFNRKGIVIIGYDATPPAVDAILKGSPLKADIVQYPKKIGMKTIDVIYDHFNNKTVPSDVPVKVGIVDKKALQKQNTP